MGFSMCEQQDKNEFCFVRQCLLLCAERRAEIWPNPRNYFPNYFFRNTLFFPVAALSGCAPVKVAMLGVCAGWTFNKYYHLLGTPQQCSCRPLVPAANDALPCPSKAWGLLAWKLFWFSAKERPIGLISPAKPGDVRLRVILVLRDLGLCFCA